MKGFNAKEDRRHDRRTLSLDELHRLIQAAEQGPAVMGMTGPARALCYRLAASTGLAVLGDRQHHGPRRSTGRPPASRWPPRYTKNGDPATLPIPSDLADDLAPYVATLAPGTPVFPLPEGKGAEMLRADLEAAGIPYQDASGLFFDFHRLRCQMATMADAAGVTPRVVQRLMRHSTLELTGRYTRPRAVDIEAAASMLPSLKPTGDRPEGLAADGDGRAVWPPTTVRSDRPGPPGPREFRRRKAHPSANALATIWPPHRPETAARLPDAGVMTGSALQSSMLGNENRWGLRELPQTAGVSRLSAASDRGGARTLDQRIKSPLLYRLSYPVSNELQITARNPPRPDPHRSGDGACPPSPDRATMKPQSFGTSRTAL